MFLLRGDTSLFFCSSWPHFLLVCKNDGTCLLSLGVSGRYTHKRNRASRMPPTPPAASGKRGQSSASKMSDSASDAGKKRKRPDDTKGTKAKQSKADQAQQRIEGVPPSLTPVLLHAIKSRRKYLAKLGSSSSADAETGAAAEAADPTDVLARVAARSDQEQQRRQAIQDADSPLERLRLASKDATTAFLNGVKREAKSGGGGRSDNGWSLEKSQGRAPARGGATADSVPVACLSFLLGLFSTDDGSVKLPTRRAALALASELLRRSAECREAFASAERLRQFIEVVSSLGSSGRDANHNGSSTNTNAENEGEGTLRALVQQEAVQLLVGLSDLYGIYSPRLSVAARFLEEREGIVLSSTTRGSGLGDIASNNAMADLRRGRDMAMAKVDKAHGRVKRILDRADKCFEILVPRFGSSGGGSSSATGKEATQDTSTNLANAWLDDNFDDGDDDDLEDDDDIDWEEGDDNDDDGSTAPEDHEKAVERTLAQMERSRGIEDGGIEISLGGGDSAGSSGGASDATISAAREMLGRCVKLLEEKHMPRLVFWSDCLHRADNMTIQTGEMSGTVQSSLVAMSPSVRKKRSETLNMVLSLKSDCSKTISSAAKLGIGSLPNNPSIQSSEGTTGKTTVPPTTNAAAGVNNNPTGVGVASASSLSASTSWKLALGIKSNKSKKRKIRIKVVSSSSRKSAVEIKSRKGL